MGQVITFYSYKGGVGRTMALANIATILAQWGYKTLLVDWDLEAPGLEFYFQDYIKLQNIAAQEGLVDLLSKAEQTEHETLAESVAWQEAIVEIEVPEAREKIHLITAGQRDKNGQYFDRVTNLDWDSFYQQQGGFLIESLRSEWKEHYDYVLIDSRTGITDIGGICTIQLPDVLVLLFTATEQSLKGATKVASKAQRAQWDLPFDRASLTCLPIPSRFDFNEEFKVSQEWLNHFSEELKEIYDDWLPTTVDRKKFLEVTKIPYSSYFSFGEKLPVIEQGTTDPTGLGYAYENIAAVIVDGFESVDKILSNRDSLVRHSLRNKLRIHISNIIDPRAFGVAFRNIMGQNPDITPDSIQSIEKQGEEVLITLEVSDHTDKAKVERDWNVGYKAGLQEGQTDHHAQDSETLIQNIFTSEHIFVSGNVAITTRDSNIGIKEVIKQVKDLVSQLSNEPTQTELKDALIRLQLAIEADTEMSDEEKIDALEEIKQIAAVGQSTQNETTRRVAKRAITVLKGMMVGLNATSKLALTFEELLPSISAFFKI
ncbi:MAG: AAA family ATPase [Cyanobacteria bacterium P01_D01_bin.128]